MTKIEKLEQLLADLTANKYRRAQAERLFFSAEDGEQVRLSDPDAADKLRARIEKERAAP